MPYQPPPDLSGYVPAHVPIDGETVDTPSQHFPGRLRPAWYPSCATCLASWRAFYEVAASVPANVPVEHALVVREGDELVLRVRCHSKSDHLDVTHATDERDLAALVFFRVKGAK